MLFETAKERKEERKMEFPVETRKGDKAPEDWSIQEDCES